MIALRESFVWRCTVNEWQFTRCLLCECVQWCTMFGCIQWSPLRKLKNVRSVSCFQWKQVEDITNWILFADGHHPSVAYGTCLRHVTNKIIQKCSGESATIHAVHLLDGPRTIARPAYQTQSVAHSAHHSVSIAAYEFVRNRCPTPKFNIQRPVPQTKLIADQFLSVHRNHVEYHNLFAIPCQQRYADPSDTRIQRCCPFNLYEFPMSTRIRRTIQTDLLENAVHSVAVRGRSRLLLDLGHFQS